MIKRRSLAMSVVIFLIWSQMARSTSGYESYVCIGDASTGFMFDAPNNSWVVTTFENPGKYVVKKSQMSKAAWEVSAVGAHTPIAVCEKDFSSGGELSCHGLISLSMSNKTMAFIATDTLGFLNPASLSELMRKNVTKKDITPSLQIGKCTRLQIR